MCDFDVTSSFLGRRLLLNHLGIGIKYGQQRCFLKKRVFIGVILSLMCRSLKNTLRFDTSFFFYFLINIYSFFFSSETHFNELEPNTCVQCACLW